MGRINQDGLSKPTKTSYHPQHTNKQRLAKKPNSARVAHRQLATTPDPHDTNKRIPPRGTKEERERRQAREDNAPYDLLEKHLFKMFRKRLRDFKTIKLPTKDEKAELVRGSGVDIVWLLGEVKLLPRTDTIMTVAHELMSAIGKFETDAFDWAAQILRKPTAEQIRYRADVMLNNILPGRNFASINMPDLNAPSQEEKLSKDTAPEMAIIPAVAPVRPPRRARRLRPSLGHATSGRRPSHSQTNRPPASPGLRGR